MYKLLIHGPQIIAHILLSIGQLSEEAQEVRNKNIKRYSEDFSRKCSREKTMEDIFNRLMVTSDPYISSIRKLPRKNLKSLSKETVELLLSPTVIIATGRNLALQLNTKIASVAQQPCRGNNEYLKRVDFQIGERDIKFKFLVYSQIDTASPVSLIKIKLVPLSSSGELN